MFLSKEGNLSIRKGAKYGFMLRVIIIRLQIRVFASHDKINLSLPNINSNTNDDNDNNNNDDEVFVLCEVCIRTSIKS